MIDRAGTVARGPKPKSAGSKPAAKKPTKARKAPAKPKRAIAKPAEPKDERSHFEAASHAAAAPKPKSVRTHVTLQHVLDTAALPSSKRIEGWRTPEFDKAKAAISKKLEADPNVPLKHLLDIKADIGPTPDKIPALPEAVERIMARNAERKGDIRPVTKLPTDVQDYVIIGSGMAGISAGAILSDANEAGANLKGLVLEGGSVVGGRMRDVDVNGKKAGLGPSWLHGKNNMLRRLADGLGLHRERTFLDREVFIDGRRATKEEEDGLFAEEEKAEDHMTKAALAGQESKGGDAASKFFPKGRWQRVAEAEMGTGDQGMNIGKVDPIDGADFASDQDDFILEGMQEFANRFAKAAHLPVAFNAQVSGAKRGDDGVWTVTLADGRTVKTKQVIYTGSTDALHNIHFGQHLPKAKLETVTDALPMGNFTKFLFTTKEPLNRPDTFRNSWVVDAHTDDHTKKLTEEVQFVVKYGDDPRANIMFADAGTAKALLALPEAQRKHAIEERFSKIAGRPVHVEQLAVTPFAGEKNFRGCYTNLLPGMEGAHTVWAAPVHGLNFAGEAAGTAQNNGSLLAAFTSGVDAAYDVIAATKLKR
jgi:monoamine oxidase